MTKQDIISLLIQFILSGGFLGGVYALLKLRPEAGQIVVTSAQSAVIVQSGVIENLREELERIEARFDAQEAEIISLREENTKLRARVRELERTHDNVSSLE